MIAAATEIPTPPIDWGALSPLIALAVGSMVALLVGLLRGPQIQRHAPPAAAVLAFAATIGLAVWQWDAEQDLVANTMRADALSMALTIIFCVAGIAATLLAWRARAPEEAGHGEFYALMLASTAGMAVLVGATNTIILFLGFELLSIPLYVLCATEIRRAASLESGLKYLIIGSVGSATLLYGLALLYGATGGTDYREIREAFGEGRADDVLALTGIALVVAGFAFKASVAPFHQWTPDVYEGAPTPVTAFMATATKAAALGVFLRFFDVALIDAALDWGPLLAALAVISIVVGNVGALGQTSVKRLLAWSSVAQAGYLLAGVLVATELGAQATVFYLGVYLVMTLAAFAVVAARERETALGDHLDAFAGLGARRPWLAVSMTVAMLSLAGIPATGGFLGKLRLIEASVAGGYTWIAVVIVLGSAASLAYYLRVVAAMWMRPAPDPALAPAGPAAPALAGGAPELDRARAGWEVVAVAVVFAALTIAAGIAPNPILEVIEDIGGSLFPGSGTL